MNNSVKHPEVTIPLIGEDGNAFSILGRVQRAMRRAGIASEWDEFHAEATDSDYDHLLATVMGWFTVPFGDEDEDEDEWRAEHPKGCYDCRELYAWPVCPSCGEEV